MINIREIQRPAEKANICNSILRALPDWFGVEASIADYAEQVQGMPFFAAFDGERAIGFAAVKEHNAHTAEICVMGILEQYHGQKIGRRLVEKSEVFCRTTGRSFLTVKTLDESRESDEYRKTRLFYHAMGFVPLEVFPLHWDADNPCLFMAKYIL